MPNKKDLIGKINGLVEILGISKIETKDLKNDKLEAILAELESLESEKASEVAAKAALDARAAADTATEKATAEGSNDDDVAAAEKAEEAAKEAQEAADTAAAEASKMAEAADVANNRVKPAVEEKKNPPYSIAEGKSLTSKRGILGPGEEIKPADLAGGADAIKSFVKSGHIIKA